MDLKKLRDQARSLVDRRGGTESLKEDAQELRDIAKGEGSLKDKTKSAVEAVKDPGEGGGEPTAPAQAPEAEVVRAEEKVSGEERGKHAGGGRRRRHGREGRRGGGDPGV